MHFQRYSSYTTVRQEGRCFYKASTYTCQGLGPRSLKLLLTDSDNTLTTEAELHLNALVYNSASVVKVLSESVSNSFRLLGPRPWQV